MSVQRARFVICVDPGEFDEIDLDAGRVYQALPTEKVDRDNGLIRVIDNSGEDYLYSADQFVEIKLPRAAREALLRARRNPERSEGSVHRNGKLRSL